MFWIVGFDSKTGNINVLDDTDNVAEWLSVDELNNILRNDYSVDIDYKEGSISRQDKYVGITENGRTCLGCNHRSGYYVFDFYKRLILKSSAHNLFKEGIKLTHNFGINDLDHSHYLYHIWEGMLNRCYISYNLYYYLYGGRGIYVDKSFQRLSKFALWYESQPNFKFRTEVNLEIDKDLLGKNYYGADSCILLPRKINSRLGKLNDIKTNALPRFCRANRNYVRLEVNHTYITDDMIDTSYTHSFYENLVIDFLNSRNITEWKYNNSMEDVGRKWITAKNIFFSDNKELCDQSLQKDWITKDYYDRLIDAFDVKITDWGLYEDH